MIVDQKRRLIQNQARLEPLCAAPDPRTYSNWACLRTPPFVSVAQNENPASCFRPGRAGRVPQPSLVRHPLDSPIESSPALLNADLFCIRFPAEATLTLVDWFDAHPSTCGFTRRSVATVGRLRTQMLLRSNTNGTRNLVRLAENRPSWGEGIVCSCVFPPSDFTPKISEKPGHRPGACSSTPHRHHAQTLA